MSNLVRRRGTLDVVDTAVGVGVGIIAAFFIIKVIGWLFSAVFFFFQVAIVAIVIAVAIKLWSGFRRHDRY